MSRIRGELFRRRTWKNLKSCWPTHLWYAHITKGTSKSPYFTYWASTHWASANEGAIAGRARDGTLWVSLNHVGPVGRRLWDNLSKRVQCTWFRMIELVDSEDDIGYAPMARLEVLLVPPSPVTNSSESSMIKDSSDICSTNRESRQGWVKCE